MTIPGSPTSSASILRLSPLSPRLPGYRKWHTNKLRNRLPTQLRRTLPLVVVWVLAMILVLGGGGISKIPLAPGLSTAGAVLRRDQAQTPLSLPAVAVPTNADGEPTHVPGFPKKIWQTWKVDPLHFDARDSATAKSWTLMNPGFRYEVLTDANDLSYVKHAFGPDGFNRPDIVDMYARINATIIKADLLRYLVMYAEGGIYADIDVEALKPAGRFVPARYDPADIDLVIGVEIDQPEFKNHPILGQKSMSFCQWTFMAKPRLPVMLHLVESIMSWMADVAHAQGVPVSDVHLDFDQVISGTGPSAFTRAVLAAMNAQLTRPVTWADFHALDESKAVARVLVLDVEALAAGQGHSDSGTHSARGALVKHHYHASNWPGRHPRFRHPVYGQVERCNWDLACVAKWDSDTAAYAALSPAEQAARVREAGAEEARRQEEAVAAQEHARQLERFAAAVHAAEEEAKREVQERRAKAEAEAKGGVGMPAAASAPPGGVNASDAASAPPGGANASDSQPDMSAPPFAPFPAPTAPAQQSGDPGFGQQALPSAPPELPLSMAPGALPSGLGYMT